MPLRQRQEVQEMLREMREIEMPRELSVTTCCTFLCEFSPPQSHCRPPRRVADRLPGPLARGHHLPDRGQAATYRDARGHRPHCP